MGSSGLRSLVLLLAVAVIGGLLWWLSGEPPTGTRSRPPVAPPGPGDAAEPSAGARADEALPPSAREATREASPLALDERPTGGRRVTGRAVRAADGTPIGVPLGFHFGTTSEDAAAVAVLVDFREARDCHTDPDGRFDVADVPGAADLIIFSGISRSSRATSSDDGERDDTPAVPDFEPHGLASGPDDALDVDVRLDTGWALTGVVTSTDGAALIDAEVDFDGFSTRTSAGGRFVLHDVILPPEQTKVWCRATAPWHAPGTQELLVPDGSVLVGPIRIELAPGGVLEGRVVDAAGAPLPDVALGIVGEAAGVFTIWERWVPPARSDGEGHFRIDGAPAGTLIVSASRPSGAERWYGDVVVRPGQTTWLDVEFPTGSRVSGRVSDPAGRPLAGVAVALERVVRWAADGDDQGGDYIVELPGGWERPSYRFWDNDPQTDERRLHRERRASEAVATTDADGRWAVEGILPGLKRLGISKTPKGSLPPPARDLLVPPGDVPVVVDVVVEQGGSIAGTVHDTDGRPVEGFVIEAWLGAEGRVEAHSDAEGRFELVGLPADRLYLDGSHTEYRSWSGWATAGDPPLMLVLECRESLHVAVVDAETGAPIPRYLLGMNADGASVLYTVESESGRFDDVVDGSDPRDLSVQTDGYQSWAAEAIRAGDTSAERPLEIRLARDG